MVMLLLAAVLAKLAGNLKSVLAMGLRFLESLKMSVIIDDIPMKAIILPQCGKVPR